MKNTLFIAIAVAALFCSVTNLSSMMPSIQTSLSKENPIITVHNETDKPVARVRLKIQYNGTLDESKPECLEKKFHEKGLLRASAVIQNLAAHSSDQVNAFTQAGKKLRTVETPTEGAKRIKSLTGKLIYPSECMKSITDITVLAVVLQQEEQPGQFRKYKVTFGEKELKWAKKGLSTQYTIQASPDGGVPSKNW